MAFSDWSLTPILNSSQPGIIWSEGMLPAQINNSARQMMADLAVLKGNGGAALIGTSGGISVEAELALMQTAITLIAGTLTSGRLGYTTYALLAANITSPAGTLAEVPITDAGTHTDPVVGGVVNNTGIFKWVASPAGWQRLYDTDAASGKPYATAAAASAVAAAASAVAAAASAASFATDVPFIYKGLPIHGDDAKGLVQGCNVANATSINSGNTVTVGGSSASFTFSSPPSLLAARNAGLPVTFVFEKVSGAALTGAPQIIRKTADGSTNLFIGNMVLANDGNYYITMTLENTGVAATTCGIVQINATSAGSTVMKMPGYAAGNPARRHADPKLLTAEGQARAAIDTITPFPITLGLSASAGTTLSASGVLTIPAGGGSSIDLNCGPVIADGSYGVASFECSVPLNNVINGAGGRYDINNGHGGAPLTLPVLEQISDTLYQVVFDVQTAGGFPFNALRLNFSNTLPIAATISNFQLWPGKVLPSHTAVGALEKQYSDGAAYLAIGDVQARHRVHVWGDSTSLKDAQPLTNNWPVFLQARSGDNVIILNHAFGGNVSKVSAAQMAARNPVITITGNQLPADLTPVAVTAFDIAPRMQFTNTNPALDNVWLVEGVKCVALATAYDGSQNPTNLTLTRVTPGAVTSVPAGSRIMNVQGLQATNDFHIVWIGFNSSGETVTGLYPVVARVGMQNCLIMPPLQALSTSATNPFTATMQAAWPGRVYDPNFAPTTAELAYLAAKYGYAPDATDLSYIALNKIPPGLRLPSDNIHLNNMGGDMIAQRVYNSPQYQTFLFNKQNPDAATGSVQMFLSAPNQQWLQCNGGTFSAVTYPTLAALLGTTTLPNVPTYGTTGQVKAFIYAGPQN